MAAKKKFGHQLDKKHTEEDRKKIIDAQKAEPQRSENYQPLYKELNKLVPIDRNRYR
jgi:hypothetical protein